MFKKEKIFFVSEIVLCVVLLCFSVFDWLESINYYVMLCNCLILWGGGEGCK